MEPASQEVRKRIRLKKPNPLFEAWLNEWKGQAEAIGSDVRYKYEKALESLAKYPLVLSSGKECLILEHFDAALCIRLDRRLVEFKKSSSGSGGGFSSLNHGVSAVGTAGSSGSADLKQPCDVLVSASSAAKPASANSINSLVSQREALESGSPKRKNRPYLPKKRTGAFAILVTLLTNQQTNGSKDWMSKAELQAAGQPLCDVSFTKPDPGSFYTGWSSMSGLLSKGHVKKQSQPPRFSLTDSGLQLAETLVSLHPEELDGFQVQWRDATWLLTSTADILAPGKKNQPKPSPVKKRRKKTTATQESVLSQRSVVPEESGPEYFLPGSFDVILLVDTAETIGAQKKSQDLTLRELAKCLVRYEVRKLNVGDFLWIARHRESGKELALPYIVERKRLDDLAKSIKDGRFHEQKFRLKNCGLQCLIYLVEQIQGDFVGLPRSTLNFSITRTQVSDHFSVQIKKNHRDSMLYLGQVTTVLTKLFEMKTLFCCKKEDLPNEFDVNDEIVSLCTFMDFHRNIGKTRNFSVKETLQRQLLRLHGVSTEMSWAVVQQFSTPFLLRKAFLADGERLLEDVEYGPSRRKIGPVVSRTLHQFYTLSHFPS